MSETDKAPSKRKKARVKDERTSRGKITPEGVENALNGLLGGFSAVGTDVDAEPEQLHDVVACGGVDASAVDSDDTGDITSIRYNNERLRNLGDAKQKLTDELMALANAEKDDIALIKAKLSILESQEKECRENLKLFNKKHLENAGGVDLIRIEIVDYTGDTFRAAGMLGAK